MCFERRTGPAAAAVAVVLCWSAVARTATVSETSITPDANILAAQSNGIDVTPDSNGGYLDISLRVDESFAADVPLPGDGGHDMDASQTFHSEIRISDPLTSSMTQVIVPETATQLASSDDAYLAFHVDSPTTIDEGSTTFDVSGYRDKTTTGIHANRNVGVLQGTPVPEPAIVGGLLALALLAFITWRKRA